MRVMVFHMATEPAEGPMEPTPEMLESFQAMDRFQEELVEAGVFVAAAGLKPASESRRLVFEGDTVIDGPFAEVKEMVAGFSIWEVKDIDEALAWARRAPNPTGARGALEIRPFYEVADLAAFVTEEDLANPRTGERGRLGVA